MPMPILMSEHQRKYRQNSSQNSLGPSIPQDDQKAKNSIKKREKGDRARKPKFPHGTQIRIEILVFHVKHQYFYFLS
jgi:hypothetical protein